MNDLKKGMRFKNNIIPYGALFRRLGHVRKRPRLSTPHSMEMEVIELTGPENINVAFLYCVTDGLYVTARDLTKMRNGSYTWIWGHYFSNKQKALDDYNNRLKDLNKL